MSCEAVANLWIGPVSASEWSREANWSLGHVPTPEERAVFRRAATVIVQDEHQVGRLEVDLGDPASCVAITGSGRLVLWGSDRLLGKPVSLQVESGILELHIEVCVAAPRFTALPGGTIRVLAPNVRAVEPDLKIAVCHGGVLDIGVPRWEPGMHLDLATSRTRGSGSHKISLSGAEHSEVIFESLKEHDGDEVDILGYAVGDVIAFRDDPYRSTDPGKELRLSAFSFADRREKASFMERKGTWFLLPEGVEPPSNQGLQRRSHRKSSPGRTPLRVTVLDRGSSLTDCVNADRVGEERGGVEVAPGLIISPAGGAHVRQPIRIARSEDRGKTWHFGPPVFEGSGIDLSYPTMAKCEPGRLLMLLSTNTHRLYQSRSEDSGRSWTRPTEVTRLISPNSPSSLSTIGDTLYVVWNRNSRGTTPLDRCPLTFGYSIDWGETWTVGCQIETDPTYLYTDPHISPMIPAREAGRSNARLLVTYTAIPLETGVPQLRFIRLEVAPQDASQDHNADQNGRSL